MFENLQRMSCNGTLWASIGMLAWCASLAWSSMETLYSVVTRAQQATSRASSNSAYQKRHVHNPIVLNRKHTGATEALAVRQRSPRYGPVTGRRLQPHAHRVGSCRQRALKAGVAGALADATAARAFTAAAPAHVPVEAVGQSRPLRRCRTLSNVMRASGAALVPGLDVVVSGGCTDGGR